MKTSSDFLLPALDLISRHSPRLDAVETLQLLPPLVTAHDVRTFLLEALRAPIFDTRVVREISKSRRDQLARNLMVLQAKRVKVTDSRMYGLYPMEPVILFSSYLTFPKMPPVPQTYWQQRYCGPCTSVRPKPVLFHQCITKLDT